MTPEAVTIPVFADYCRQPALFGQEPYPVQRKLMEMWCQAGNYLETLNLINESFDFGIEPEFIDITAKIYSDRLDKVLRFGGNNNMPDGLGGTSASHSTGELLLIGNIFKPTSKDFASVKKDLGKTALMHEIGESYGELSTLHSRSGNGTHLVLETENKLIEIIEKIEPEQTEVAERLRGKINTVLETRLMTEETRNEIERLIADTVISKYTQGSLKEEMLAYFQTAEEETVVGITHKLIERLQTNQHWLVKGHEPKTGGVVQARYVADAREYVLSYWRKLQDYVNGEESDGLTAILRPWINAENLVLSAKFD